MNKETIIKNTEIIVNAPSCCPELKTAGNDWLNSIGKTNENEKFNSFIAELKECITPIDVCIAFAESDICKNMFGEEGAKNMYNASVAAKKKGVKHCICDACTKGAEILEGLN